MYASTTIAKLIRDTEVILPPRILELVQPSRGIASKVLARGSVIQIDDRRGHHEVLGELVITIQIELAIGRRIDRQTRRQALHGAARPVVGEAQQESVLFIEQRHVRRELGTADQLRLADLGIAERNGGLVGLVARVIGDVAKTRFERVLCLGLHSFGGARAAIGVGAVLHEGFLGAADVDVDVVDGDRDDEVLHLLFEQIHTHD